VGSFQSIIIVVDSIVIVGSVGSNGLIGSIDSVGGAMSTVFGSLSIVVIGLRVDGIAVIDRLVVLPIVRIG
jgi:hypothetical protein